MGTTPCRCFSYAHFHDFSNKAFNSRYCVYNLRLCFLASLGLHLKRFSLCSFPVRYSAIGHIYTRYIACSHHWQFIYTTNSCLLNRSLYNPHKYYTFRLCNSYNPHIFYAFQHLFATLCRIYKPWKLSLIGRYFVYFCCYFFGRFSCCHVHRV